ncbi:exonuclease domain-containing protein [Spongiibacter sp.]|uniref:3'-5' exonuclease family protein n=1 Tax=Spongiibacter sp. TaxID=2024860 RepID=UPI003561D7E3
MLSTMRWALLDLETTGASAADDEITEVAVVTLAQGEEEHWQSLVKVDGDIPVFIQRLTGINAELLAGAPAFEALAPELFARLAGAVLVAHNARFDAGFLTQSFRRQGLDYRPQILCTLKLARSLYPDWPKHGLDALCENIGYRRDVSHRAMADVLAMKAFLAHAIAEHGEPRVLAEVRAQLQGPSLPAHLSPADLKAVPARPGVYAFYDEKDAPLYVAKSDNMRLGVAAYFSAQAPAGTLRQLSRKLRRIEATETAGELGAGLLESTQIARLRPRYNRQGHSCVASLQADEQGYLQLHFLPSSGDSEGGELFLFKHHKLAWQRLRKIAEQLRVCPRRMAIDRAELCCEAQGCAEQLRGCERGGGDQLSAEAFNAQFRAQLESSRVAAWPFSGPVLIAERRAKPRRCDWHLVDRWRYYGSFSGRRPGRQRCAERLAEARPFDADHYYILQAFYDRLDWQLLIPPKR